MERRRWLRDEMIMFKSEEEGKGKKERERKEENGRRIER